MKTLIVGYKGEVGSALFNILHGVYPDIFGIDKDEELNENEFDIMHVCIGYSPDFVQIVKDYQAEFNPVFTVIHSTIPPGTSRQLDAVHSPVIGIHPNLEEGIRTFPKYLGGEHASEVADYFRRAGLTVYLFDKSETTELMKILDTTFYGVCIEYVKDVKKQCKKFDVPFEAWTLWTHNYNEGYRRLGHPEFSRPNLVPIQTQIKGHCVMPNAKLLETKFTKFLNENS